MTVIRSELCGYTTLPEPDLIFGGNKPDKHPLRGLIDSGPYGLRIEAPSRVRLALLAPRERRGQGVAEEGREERPVGYIGRSCCFCGLL